MCYTLERKQRKTKECYGPLFMAPPITRTKPGILWSLYDPMVRRLWPIWLWSLFPRRCHLSINLSEAHTHAPKWITSKMFGPWNLHTWRTMSHYSIGVCNFVCVCVNVQFMFMQKHRYVCVLNRCQPPISFLRHHPLCLLKPDFSLAWNRVSQAG